jgi:methionyl aminopeptidase
MKLAAGLTIAIEPMVNVGSPETREMPDRWTIVTADGSRSAHFEHTVAITDQGPRILTRVE